MSKSSSSRTINEVLMAAAHARSCSSKKKLGDQTPNSKEFSSSLSNKKMKLGDQSPNLKEPIQKSSKSEDQSLHPTATTTTTPEETSVQLKKRSGDFNPNSAAFWKKGESVPFLFLARAFDLIDKESRRTEMSTILCNTFRTVIATTPKDLTAVVYLSCNKIAPSYEDLELGLGETSLVKAIADAYKIDVKHIKSKLKILGDLGLVAKASCSSQVKLFNYKPPPLTVVKVLDTCRTIAKESGKDSQGNKRGHVKGLLDAATDCEPQYLFRLLQSKMRIGLAEQTVLVALGQAAVYSENQSALPSPSALDEATEIIKKVYSLLSNFDKIIPALLESGIWKLAELCRFTPGVPIGPMLAKPTRGVSEILKKFHGSEFTCEYKYDGERAQIHYMEDGSVEIYSRNGERNTGKFPDVANSVKRFKKSSITSFVIDCEVVAYDVDKQKILPFQILSTRARKGVNMNDITVKVCVFVFDLLYLNGESLLEEQLIDRREHLYDSFEEVTGEFQFATTMVSYEPKDIQSFSKLL
ncbi:hypothetical protein AQUCO_26200001v1 [Aquilegia coerulea]|uniref:DNA ligase n=1 Tax=Aquilegia coerulea TaxID=218851 RepID=A0A2G5C0K5_AQUCA|nr:hypothetical protein AQUCO_26200001v1 [Aquilegia coerulea]